MDARFRKDDRRPRVETAASRAVVAGPPVCSATLHGNVILTTA